MAKFIKSMFTPSVPENRVGVREHEPEEEGPSPIRDRNKLSMSRSGRLRHANKVRNSLSKELYGREDDMQQPESKKSIEYHVHQSALSEPKVVCQSESSKRKNADTTGASTTNGPKSPEEEIDSAFENIDKS